MYHAGDLHHSCRGQLPDMPPGVHAQLMCTLNFQNRWIWSGQRPKLTKEVNQPIWLVCAVVQSHASRLVRDTACRSWVWVRTHMHVHFREA